MRGAALFTGSAQLLLHCLLVCGMLMSVAADFCFNTYAVKFPMFTKSVVAGKDANPLFAALARATGKPPTWNFHKYVVDRQGKVIAAYPGEVAPGDPALLATLQKALANR
ncbi:MAG: cobalamin ABC transporter permease [Burkholderiaceae bacterium]